MGQYGRAACIAADLVASGATPDLAAAWREAILQVSGSRSSRAKGCPRSTFLAICGAGAIRQVPRGEYTSSPDNKRYALRALQALREDASLAEDSTGLWGIATQASGKGHSGQMDVMLGLFKGGWLV